MNKFVALILLIILVPTVSAVDDYKFFYGVSWSPAVCDNVQLAVNLGYHYINYGSNMENCPAAKNLKFYLVDSNSPKMVGFSADVNLTQPRQTPTQIQFIQDFYSWGSNDVWPYNMATGYFNKPDTPVLVPDFQQQRVVDAVINYSLEKALTRERPANNFTFAGYSWDVPQLEGDFWSDWQGRDEIGTPGSPGYVPAQPGDGQQVTIRYWTGTDSSYLHTNITHEYATYRDGKAAYYKQLFATSRQYFSEVRFIVEPWNPYYNWAVDVKDRNDYDEFTPDLICVEAHSRLDWTLQYLFDSRLYSSLGIGYDDICSTQPNIFSHNDNLFIMGELASRGGWQGNYGRWGGSGDVPRYTTAQVPMRFKLLKVVAGWENLNNVPLNERHWDNQTLIYYSTKSYVDSNVIMSTHPRNNLIYFVILDASAGIPLRGLNISQINRTNTLMTIQNETTRYQIINDNLYLVDSSDVGLAFVITPQENSVIVDEEIPVSNERDNQNLNNPPMFNQQLNLENLQALNEEGSESCQNTTTIIYSAFGIISLLAIIGSVGALFIFLKGDIDLTILGTTVVGVILLCVTVFIGLYTVGILNNMIC